MVSRPGRTGRSLNPCSQGIAYNDEVARLIERRLEGVTKVLKWRMARAAG